MASLIRSLSEAGGQAAGSILDGPAIAQSMSAAPGVASATLKNTSPSAVEGRVVISNINEFIVRTGFVKFERGRCEIDINRGNGPVILELLSPEIAAYLTALMAPIATGEELGKEEYLSLVSTIYSRAISDEIAGSRIRASVDFPGSITGVKGGTFSGRRAEFDISLLDLLVLETPMVFVAEWR
jgi:hypothetical protein